MTLAEFLAQVRESVQSLEGQASAVRMAWYAKDEKPSILDVFDDYVIVQTADGDLAKVPYTVAADVVTFGAAQKVELEFKPVREVAELVKPLDKTGAKWEARVLRFGESKNGWVWTRESGEQLMPLLAGAPVCLYPNAGHAPEATILLHGGPDPARMVGKIQAPRLEADGVYGEVHISEALPDLRKQLLTRATAGDPVGGLSVDTLCQYIPVRIKEAVKRLIRGVSRLISVDIVNRPSADGALLWAREAVKPTQGGSIMNREELIALIKEHRPALLEGRVMESLTDEDLKGLVREALTEPKPKGEPKIDPPRKPVVEIDAEADARLKRMEALELSAQVRESVAHVTEALAAAPTLPELSRARIRKEFEGKVATAEVIKARVTEEVEFLGKLSKSGEVKGYGEAGRVVLDSRDKVQAGVDLMMGVDADRLSDLLKRSPMSDDARAGIAANTVAASTVRYEQPLTSVREAMKDPGLKFKGLRDFYTMMTGDESVSGIPRRSRVSEVIESSSWAEILANSMYRRLLMDYLEPTYNESTIASFGAANDFRTKDIDILGYFSDISDVDPEAADYVEIAPVGDDKVSYAVTQRGNILTITRKTIINDDLRAVQKLVGRLGRAARHTLATFVWAFWRSNSTYQVDSLAWFHSTHGNTGSTALTADATGATEVLAKIAQLANMTEQGSGNRLGRPDKSTLWLDVPHELWGVARSLNQTLFFGTTASNPVAGFFGSPEGGERINDNPLFTDVTDWGIHVTPGAGGREQIVIDFLQGRQEPEFFLADNPTVGQMFLGDKLQYKIRHEYGGVLADFKGAVKNVVAG